MGDKVWQVSQDQFVAAWNSANDLDEVARKVQEPAGGAAPQWAIRARAGTLSKNGAELKTHAIEETTRTPAPKAWAALDAGGAPAGEPGR